MQDAPSSRHRRLSTRLSTLWALAVLGTLSVGGCTLRGSGVEQSEVRELEHFDTIELGGVFELVVHVDPSYTQKVELSGDDNILDKVVTKVSGDELEISVDHWMVRPDAPLKLEVWLPNLVELDASGASDIEVEGLHGARFELDVSGASDVELSGIVDEFVVDSSGASELAAKHLRATKVDIELSGAGDASVYTSQHLEADISGAADLVYYGDPQEIGQDVSGSGEIKPGVS